MATLPTGYPCFSLSIYLGVLLETFLTFPMCWLTYCVAPDLCFLEGKSFHLEIPLSFFRWWNFWEHFCGTLWFDLMKDVFYWGSWKPPAGPSEFGSAATGGRHSGGAAQKSNDRSSECVWDSQCSGLRMGGIRYHQRMTSGRCTKPCTLVKKIKYCLVAFMKNQPPFTRIRCILSPRMPVK